MESLGSLVGLFIATLLAGRFFPWLADFFGGGNFANIISFIIIFGVSVKLTGIVFWLFGKIFQIIMIIPFLSTFDSLLGLILGIVEGIFVSAILLYFVGKYPIHPWLVEQVAQSVTASVLLKIGSIFIPFFPEAVKKIKIEA